MSNPINESGVALEDALESFLKTKSYSYKVHPKGRSGTKIDFIVKFDGNPVYIECHNQNVGGSVEEKLPHKVYKYYEDWQPKELFLVIGKHKISNRVLRHILFLEQKTEMKVHVLTLSEMIGYLSIDGDLPKNMSPSDLKEFI